MTVRARIWPAVLCVLVAAALLGVGLLGWRAFRAEQARDEVDRAVAAARSGIEEVYSYDSSTLGEDLARARALVTGPFAAQFEQTARDVIVPAGRERSFTAVVAVARIALVDAGPGRVDVLLLADQTVRASTQPQPEQQDLQLAVTMTRDGDGPWLISRSDPL
ncbi:MAG: hypothetical protein AB7V44_09965 [Pseudonocardia sp.]